MPALKLLAAGKPVPMPEYPATAFTVGKLSLLNWLDSLKRLQFAQQALAASRVELELAQKRYETGLADIVELEDAQRHYTDDDAEYATALYGFAVDKAALDQATARSLTDL